MSKNYYKFKFDYHKSYILYIFLKIKKSNERIFIPRCFLLFFATQNATIPLNFINHLYSLLIAKKYDKKFKNILIPMFWFVFKTLYSLISRF